MSQIRYGLGQPPKQLEGGLPLIRATNIDSGRIVTKDLLYVDPNDVPHTRDAFLRTDEIVVVRSGAYTGDSAIIPSQYDGAVAGYDMVVRVTKAHPKFIAYGLLSIPALKNQIDLCRLRAAQPHLNAEDLGDCCFAVPPIPEQEKVVGFLDRKMTEIDLLVGPFRGEGDASCPPTIGVLVDKLLEYRQALLSLAVTGQISLQ